MQAVRSLHIPVRESNHKVEVFVDEFPDDVNDIIDILRAEIAPLDIWLQFAVEYYRQGKVEPFLELLTIASDPETEPIYTDTNSTNARLRILNALAAHYINLMWRETDNKKHDSLEQQAVSWFQKADRIGRDSQTLIGKGIITLAKGDDDKAMTFLEPVLKSHPNNLAALLGLGCYYFRKKKYESARATYEKAIKLNPLISSASSIRVCYGLCCYKMGQFRRATESMRRALELDPKNANAMVGLALIEEEEASKNGNVSEAKGNTLLMMHRAFNAVPNNPLVLNHISHTYFLQWDDLPGGCRVRQGSNIIETNNDYSDQITAGCLIRLGNDQIYHVVKTDHKIIFLEKNYNRKSRQDLPIYIQDLNRASGLATTAHQSTQVDAVKAESYYMLGRIHHSKGLYEEAYQFYIQARMLSPDFTLACYALGQVYLHKRMFEKATASFEEMLRSYPNDYDTLLVLGHLYAKANKKKEALACLQKAVDIESNVEVLVEIAQIQQHSLLKEDLEHAYRCYLMIEKLLIESFQDVSSELYNNIAVLQHKMKNYTESKDYYLKGIHRACAENRKQGVVEPPGDYDLPDDINPLNATIWYNLGRLHEDQGEVAEALKIYNQILKAFPDYLDCYLRLGIIDRDYGRIELAEEKFNNAINRKPPSPDAYALLANINLSKERKNYNKAQKLVEAIMGMPQRKNDAYAMLTLGNIYIASLEDAGKYDKHLDTAKSYYKSILQADSSNMYAANGIGIYFAEKGLLEAAKRIFGKISDLQIQMPSAALNLAHIHLAQDRPSKAARIYEITSKECYENRDTEILLLLANALFNNESYDDCIRVLSKALHLDPDDNALWYNLAVTMEEYAVKTLEDSVSRTLAKVEKAVIHLKNSEATFSMLCSNQENLKWLPLDKREKPQQHLQYCKETMIAALKHLEYERIKEEQKLKDIEKQLILKEEYEKKKKLKEEEERIHQEEEKKRMAEQYMKKREHLEKLQHVWQQKQLEQVSSKKPVKKRKKADDDDEGSGRSSGDEEGGKHWHRNANMEKLLAKKKKQKGKEPKDVDEKDIFGSDSEEDHNELPPASEADQERDLFGSDSD